MTIQEKVKALLEKAGCNADKDFHNALVDVLLEIAGTDKPQAPAPQPQLAPLTPVSKQ
jgi:hypothetical protein